MIQPINYTTACHFSPHSAKSILVEYSTTFFSRTKQNRAIQMGLRKRKKEAWRMHPGSEWREKNDSEVEMGVRGLREPGEACFAGVARGSLQKGRWTRSS